MPVRPPAVPSIVVRGRCPDRARHSGSVRVTIGCRRIHRERSLDPIRHRLLRARLVRGSENRRAASRADPFGRSDPCNRATRRPSDLGPRRTMARVERGQRSLVAAPSRLAMQILRRCSTERAWGRSSQHQAASCRVESEPTFPEAAKRPRGGSLPRSLRRASPHDTTARGSARRRLRHTVSAY